MSNEYLPPVLKEFKYYNGEEENNSPYPADDVRTRYWWGERMFAGIDEYERLFTEYMKDIKNWKRWLKENKQNQSAHLIETNSERQLCVAYYIVLLYSKWCPYDDSDFIFEY